MHLCTLFVYAQNELQDLTGTKAQAFDLMDMNENIISSKTPKKKLLFLIFGLLVASLVIKKF